MLKKSRHSDPFLGFKSHSMQPQGLELMRLRAGLSAARARGRQGGRKKRLDPTKRAVALRLYHERNHTVEEICRMMGVGRSTLYNYLTEAERDVLQSP
jgi:DNA invertase Pin-like site-specific DNA recombinase